MATGPRYHVQFRRRRQGRTDYRMRKKLITSGLPRAVVRCTAKNTIIQFINFNPLGDEIVAAATTMELEKLGWKNATGNLPSAYLAGFMAGKRASKEGVGKAVLDIGLKPPKKGTKVFAALKGMLDAGIDISHGDDILPSEERISGTHINEETAKMFESVVNKIKEA
ncbi:MAG: 50S ribosomal protein L18 [Candidatus Thermoplasmatota archaeon]|nr:50S ribosomal protein L18 [Euryarchaeota archaeon]MBU4031927.1 50S ribosomal protein L18 [Candidatus Thermoplasmatota archaeon]MBU4071510.1 50S ribosomal protein L18 [Candidatus Thermoplasmatota archaeon]MBU4144167.1 50S ribosomal protein L18 [Candidatus Thermoplasmatota archaeon]MBU4592801.1 50S ribosomal protein L18 [Candidatus Thermoplasmatota archaeon]